MTLEPQQHIEDTETTDRWPMFAETLQRIVDRIARRIRLWRIDRRLGR